MGEGGHSCTTLGLLQGCLSWDEEMGYLTPWVTP